MLMHVPKMLIVTNFLVIFTEIFLLENAYKSVYRNSLTAQQNADMKGSIYRNIHKYVQSHLRKKTSQTKSGLDHGHL